jgi:tRNA dimethylallyltransferase
VVEEILSRGKTPLFVGGTPLYLKTLLRGMFEGPAADWELRRSLEALAATKPPGTLQEMLREVDPTAAAKLHANDTRRLVRALEVFRLTGKPISEH